MARRMLIDIVHHVLQPGCSVSGIARPCYFSITMTGLGGFSLFSFLNEAPPPPSPPTKPEKQSCSMKGKLDN